MSDTKAAAAAIKATAKELTFGVEMETIGESGQRIRDAVLRSLQNNAATDLPAAFSFAASDGVDRYRRAVPAITQYDIVGGRHLNPRKWTFTRDGSLSSDRNCEIVSPVLTARDMPVLQMIARAAKAAGARADHSCGVHVHVGTAKFQAKTLKALMAQVGAREDLIRAALQIHARRDAYTRKVPQRIKDRFRSAQVQPGETPDNFAMRAIRDVSDRYVGLNMTSLFSRPTVEFRWFNGTLHAGRIKAYVQLCTHMAASAINTKVVVWDRFKQYGHEDFTLGEMGKFLRAFGIDKADAEYATAYDVLTRAFRRSASESVGA